MNDKFKKIAESRKERENNPAYEMEEDWTVYGPNCPEHVATRRFLVGDAEKAKLGHSSNTLVWRCPVDGKIFVAEGGVDQQTDGFAEFNRLHKNTDSIMDDGFEAAKKLAKEMGYIESGPESD